MYHITVTLFISLLFAVSASSIVYAQNNPRKTFRHELCIGGGFGEEPDNRFKSYCKNLESFYDMGSNDWFLGTLDVLNLQYYYRINRRFALGGIVGNTTSRESCISVIDREIPVPNERPLKEHVYYNHDINQRTFYFLPTVKWTWMDARFARLYMKVGAGAYVQSRWMTSDYYEQSEIKQHDETIWMLTYQLTPLGLELGSDRFCFFLEGGYGINGIVAVGLKYSFKRTDIHLQ